MNPKTYNDITLVCILVAVFSALTFSSEYLPNWATGGLGVAAAVVAVFLYFRYGGESDESPSQRELRLDNFPDRNKDKIKRIKQNEFKKIIEEERPEKIFAEYSNHDDLGPWGSFYIQRSNGEIVETFDHYPITKEDGSIDSDSHYSLVMDRIPYRLVEYPGLYPFGQYTGKSKFVRSETAD